MKHQSPLLKGVLLKRYKRFLADFELEDGTKSTAHCTNTGSMKGVLAPPQVCYVSKASNPNRKLGYTLEALEVDGVTVGVNTHMTNKIAEYFIQNGDIDLGPYKHLLREKKYGENSRIDILLEGDVPHFVEVKNVSLVEEHTAKFPDSPSERGQKHLRELSEEVKKGNKATMLYISQRADAEFFAPAEDIDPEYAKLLKVAVEAGVKAVAYAVEPNIEGFTLKKQLKVRL